MKISHFLISLFLCASCLTAYAQQQLHPDSLANEFSLLQEALKVLHSGLQRFKSEAEINRYFDASLQRYQESGNLKEAFLNLSEFTAGLRCGHTYPNYWNQERSVQEALFNATDKLPFTFVWVEDVMLIRENVSFQEIPENSRIVSINAIATDEIKSTLLKYVRTDGDNTLKKIELLGIDGQGKFETFDVLFPLLFPPKQGTYTVEVLDEHNVPLSYEVSAVSRFDRMQRLQEKYGIQPITKDLLWHYESISKNTTLLKLGTFAVWEMKMDWKAYLSDFFQTLADTQTEHLILDLRGNEGGLTEVWIELFSYLYADTVQLIPYQQRLSYQKVPEHLQPYLSTWDKDLFDRGEEVIRGIGDYYRFADISMDTLTIIPSLLSFTGKVVVLVDAANSSGTFYFANYLRNMQRATLVGQTTGGNLQGTNGGDFFMMRLPYSQLEVDIPLIGYYPNTEQPNQGIEPDVHVPRTLSYYQSAIDLDIEKALQFLEK